MPKRTLRQSLIQKRKELTLTVAAELGRPIQERFIESAVFRAAGSVALYSPVHGEVGTDLVFEAARRQGKEVLYPSVCGDHLIFRMVSDGGRMTPKAFGILEPDQGCPEMDPQKADVLVIPGVGFDLSGNRIGYGKGYYDRVLHASEGSGRLVGFCYDFQVVDQIIAESHDVRVDWIFTETRTIRVSNI